MMVVRRFLLDENKRLLIDLWVDEATASNAFTWRRGAEGPGAPADLSMLLAAAQGRESVQVFVEDRVLCDAVQRNSCDRAAMEYHAYREALFTPTLARILPLENQSRSYKPMDEPDSFSVCTYGIAPTESVWMSPPAEALNQTPEGSWQVSRSDIDPVRRLDCWYYQNHFRKLRLERTQWGTHLFSEKFTVAEERAYRKPLLDRPVEGALKWLSSAQINERLHAIGQTRIRDWGQAGRDVPLNSDDLLISMFGFTGVKLARYYGPPNDATRSLYLLRTSPKFTGSERDLASVWFELTCDDFIDQLRMHLSDRVMKPLTTSLLLLNNLRIPPLPSGVTAGMAFVLDALTRLALGGESVDELDANLRRVEEALEADDVPWPGKWSCLRLLARHRMVSGAERKVVVLSNDPAIGRKCVADLKKRLISAVNLRTFAIAHQGLEPGLAQEVAAAAAVISITSSVAPLASVSEQLGAAHALDIASEAHMFALYAEEGEKREFPARQFLDHLFSEVDKDILSLDISDGDVGLLIDRVVPLLENFAPATCDEVIDRLAQLDSPSETFVRFASVTARTSLLDRVRPALTGLSGRLKAHKATQERVAPHIALPRERQKPHVFGKFITHNDELAKTIRNLEDMYLRALDLTKKGAFPVIALLIEGETGCGKDALINYLDTLQQANPFVRFGVNVDASFVLSQLFGHAKGAFTGASTVRAGIFESAFKKECPVFLNEINSYQAEVQFRLLTVIEYGNFFKLGREEGEALEYRGVVVAASNESLSTLVDKGDFRLDLQMRLGSPILIPRLRAQLEKS